MGNGLVQRSLSAVAPGSFGSEKGPASPRSISELVSNQSSLVRSTSIPSDCCEVRLSPNSVAVSRAHTPGSGAAPPTAIPPLRP